MTSVALEAINITMLGMNNTDLEVEEILKRFNLTMDDIEYIRNYTSTNPIPTALYCGQGIKDFREVYSRIHGYIALMVCLLGIVCNLLNILVLTRKEMASPTNTILTALAGADVLVMIEYIPFAFYMYLLHHKDIYGKFTYGWAMFVLFHANFTQICHTTAIGLTLLLAVWRYTAMSHYRFSSAHRGRARKANMLVFVISVIVCVPFYFTFHVRSVESKNAYVVGYSELAEEYNGLMDKITFWIYSVIIKLIPCCLLSIVSFGLIRTLSETRRRHKLLKDQSPMYASGLDYSRDKSDVARKQAVRTTRILLAILVLFLLTELPQGILGLLSGIIGKRFFYECYQNLAEVMDVLALTNSAINFILYCCMSSQFRRTFNTLFHSVPSELFLTVNPSPNKVTANGNNSHVTAL